MMFLDRCKALLSEFENLRRDFHTRGKEATTTGSVSVGLPVPATRFLGRTFISDFNSHYSGISLRIVEGFSALLYEWLLSGSLDLAILYGPTHSKILTSEPVLVEDLYAITAATPENRQRSSISAAELASAPLILPNRPHVLRDMVDQLHFKNLSFIEVGAITMMIELARAGKGYSILPHSAVDGALAAGDIVALPIHEPNLSWEVSICYSNLRPLSAPAEVMLRLVRKELVRMVREGHWTARLTNADGR